MLPKACKKYFAVVQFALRLCPDNDLESFEIPITSVERNKEQHLYTKNMLTMGIIIEKSITTIKRIHYIYNTRHRSRESPKNPAKHVTWITHSSPRSPAHVKRHAKRARQKQTNKTNDS